MRTRIVAAALLLGLGMAMPAGAVEIQRTEKLGFAPGSNALTVPGTVQGKGVVDYKVFVRKGQLLAVGVVVDHRELFFNVLAPDGVTKIFDGSTSGNQSEDAAPLDGEYVVRVYLAGRAMQKLEPTRFRLEIRVKQPD